jgi:hypothetical protein
VWPSQGRRGNRFIEITIALLVCRICGISTVYIPGTGEFFNRSFVTTQGVHVIVGEKPTIARRQRGGFYPGRGQFGACPASMVYEAAESVRHEVLRYIPKPNISDKTLVMHFRAGDVFNSSQWCQKWYGQPSCNFYTDAMEINKDHDKVLLMAEDMSNPCIQVCLDRGAVMSPLSSIENDFAVLLWSRKLVLSRSTLMRPAMYWSPYQKEAYMFGGLNLMDVGWDDVGWNIWRPFGRHWHCKPPGEFVSSVMFNWTKDPAKMGRLLTTNCTWVRAFESESSVVKEFESHS